MAARFPKGMTPLVIDTHAHVAMDDFSSDRDSVIARARSAGVNFLEVGYDGESSARAVLLARKIRGKCAVGIHPHYAHDLSSRMEEAWSEIEASVETGGDEVVAVGEIGLDYARGTDFRDTQVECFERGLDLARRRGMPVIVHQRDAEEDVLRMVRSARLSKPVVFHCFTGDQTYAAKCLDLGGYIGLGGVLTYPRNRALRETVRSLPKDRLLLETDSPYLAPQSHRGHRNEPAFVLEVRDLLSELLGISVEEVATTTARNARDAFLAEIGWRT